MSRRDCRCDHCARGWSSEHCACGHPFKAHAAERFHSCMWCLWCDEFRVSRDGK